MKTFSFENLFILDLANNHQGDVDHGLKIIESLGEVVATANVNATIKFQFRQLETFIHPEFVNQPEVPHVERFLSTRLDLDQYVTLAKKVKEMGMHVMCTPFDEESLPLLGAISCDAVKIASCSATDHCLIDSIKDLGLPVVASTGGATLSQIEKLVFSFMDAGVPLALEHCVSVYPTPIELQELNQIDVLKRHFPNIPVGWSTHEDPKDFVPVMIAVAKGASLFERHVGLESDKYSLNKYSSNPTEIKHWLEAYREAIERCGAAKRKPASISEVTALNSLKRGVFAKHSIKKGDAISRQDIYFAIPVIEGALDAESWKPDCRSDQDYEKDQPLCNAIANYEHTEDQMIEQFVHQARGMLQDARIQLKLPICLELSHHYGIKRFREFGAVLINVINREYCKKLIIQLPRQKHPYHHHKRKEETFHVLYGSMEIEVEGNTHLLNEGDLFLVEKNKWHKFSSMHGVIFEEISTTHHKNDSYYEDPRINSATLEQRKTHYRVVST
jgi:sialic acid synthase SpsE/mannose-6-phosphate isomerase-like protein (cupin superfamily)